MANIVLVEANWVCVTVLVSLSTDTAVVVDILESVEVAEVCDKIFSRRKLEKFGEIWQLTRNQICSRGSRNFRIYEGSSSGTCRSGCDRLRS